MNSQSLRSRRETLAHYYHKVPATVFLLFGMILFFSLLSDKYFTVSNIMNVIVQCSSGVGIVALASYLAICSTGVDLSLGGIVSLSGMITAKILTWDIPLFSQIRNNNPVFLLLIAVTAAIAAGAAIGSMNGLILARTKIPSFIVTLGMYKICETFSRVIAGGTTIRINGLPLFEFIGNGSLLNVQIGRRSIGLLPISMIIMLLLYIFFSFVMKKTRFGTYVYAIGGNNESAALSGINTVLTRYRVFLYGGMIAAFTGIIFTSRLTSASAQNGLGLEFDGIAAAVVGGAAMSGGRSTPGRTLIGALIISVMKNGFNMIGMSNSIQMIAIGCVLIAVVSVDTLRNRRRFV
ncbi:MAG: ABC transporter permease [Eubacteriales bacterium]|nr:ABC transporter permease [Eubacteriales bacterium]